MARVTYDPCKLCEDPDLCLGHLVEIEVVAEQFDEDMEGFTGVYH